LSSNEKLDPVDICIVGAGAGGGVLARELAARRRSVVVLDVGPRPSRAGIETYRPDWELRVENFLPGDSARDRITLGPDSAPFYLLRFKGVGGSTMHYEGQCNRLHPRDLSRFSEYGIGADWPLAYEELLPHYERVESMLGVSGAPDDRFAPPRSAYPNPPIEFSYAVKRVAAACERLGLHPAHAPLAILSRAQNGRNACNFCGGCVYGCLHAAISNMGETYIPAAERDGARILDRCMATRIRLKENGHRVDGVEFLDAQGALHFQPARAVAVCGNSVETARLLLLSSTHDHPDGLANGSGLVGRNFMVHTHVRVGAIVDERIDAYRGPNINGIVKDFYESDPRRGYVGGYLIALRNAQLGPVSFFHEWLSAERVFGPELHARMEGDFGHSLDIDSYGESFPDVNNCVVLDPDAKDPFGLPVPQITIRLSDNCRTMGAHMTKTLSDIFAAAGARETRVLREARPLGTHLMGTCRMGNDPKTSVCNPFGRTHDIDNLFIADGSVFPSATPANPTLTIQALATRTALHIDSLFARRDI
jgi:choline dehydrogenase-like flavoprotein